MDSVASKSRSPRIPLYRQVAEKVRAQYIQGHAEGVRLPSERQLAQLLGVSIATIRSAFDVLEKEGQIERLVGSGAYVLGESRSAQQHVAVLLEIDIASKRLSPFYPRIFQEVRQELYKVGIPSRPYLGHLRLGVEIGELTCREFLDDVRLNRINGVISVQSLRHPSWFAELQKRGIPLVGSLRSAHYAVEIDYENLVHSLFGILRERRRKHLALVCINNDYASNQEELALRLAGEYGLKVTLFRIPANGNRENLHGVVDLFTDREDQPDCLYVTDDTIFPAVQRVLNQLQVTHLEAEDCYVTGSDAVPLFFNRPFTHCTYPVRQRAIRLVEGMRLLLAGEEPYRHVRIPLSLVVHRTGRNPETEGSSETDSFLWFH